MLANGSGAQKGIHPLLPVYTSAPFPKGLIREMLAELRHVEVSAPITMGAVVIEDVLGTGVSILASRDMPVKE